MNCFAKKIALGLLIMLFPVGYAIAQADIEIMNDTIIYVQMIRIRHEIVQSSFAFFEIKDKYYNGNNFPFDFINCNNKISDSQNSPLIYGFKQTLKNEKNIRNVIKKINKKTYHTISSVDNEHSPTLFYNCMLQTYNSDGVGEFYIKSVIFIADYYFLQCNMADNRNPVFCPGILLSKIPVIVKVDKFLR